MGKKYKHKFIKVYAKAGCGCCETELSFISTDSANKAFAAAGLGIKDIVDDKGNMHEGIDTFYGFSLDEGEAAKRSLGYLMERI